MSTTKANTHTETEDHPWTIEIGDHAKRKDSPLYTRSRALMVKLVQSVQPFFYGGKPYQDHHGGGCWVLDDAGWMLLTLPAGIEWSAQFCADPAKVDELRRQTARVVAAFPSTLSGYETFGYVDARRILLSPITDAAGVANWTDSIFNASVPLPVDKHTGVLPNGAGYHHYPKPIVDIESIKMDDFNLFVTDAKGREAAVVPVKARGKGDGRVRVLWAHPDSPIAKRHAKAHAQGKPLVLPASHSFAKQAYAKQGAI